MTGYQLAISNLVNVGFPVAEMVKEIGVISTGKGASGLVVFGQVKIEHVTGLFIKTPRDGTAAGDKQFFARDNKRALGSNSGKRRRIMRLFNINRSVPFVPPDDPAGFRIHGIDKRSHERPDTCRKIENTVFHNNTATGWPGGNHAFIAKDFALAWSAAKFP